MPWSNLDVIAAVASMFAGVYVTFWGPESNVAKRRWLALFVALGGVSVAANIRQREESNITLVYEQPLDGKDPLSTPFVITNQGELTIRNVQFSCRVEQLVFKDYVFDGGDNAGMVFVSQPPIASIEPQRSHSTFCRVSKFKGRELETGAIRVAIAFEAPYFMFWAQHENQEYRFVTARTGDGTIRWIPPLE
jgi:hypothetical protein